jgi:hypothetical protein
MKVIVRLEDGKLIVPDTIKFLPDLTEVTVEIPDEILTISEQSTNVNKLSEKNSLATGKGRAELDAILGEYAHQRAGVSSQEDKEVWMSHFN